MNTLLNKIIRILLLFSIVFFSNIVLSQTTIFIIQTEFLGSQKAYEHNGADFVAKNPFLIGFKLHTYEYRKNYKTQLVRFEWQFNYRILQNQRYGVLDFFTDNSNQKTVHNFETLFGIRFYQDNNFRIISNKLYCKPTGSIACGISSDFSHIDMETLITAGICLSAGDYNSGLVLEFVLRPVTRSLLPFKDKSFIWTPNYGFRLGYRFSKI